MKILLFGKFRWLLYLVIFLILLIFLSYPMSWFIQKAYQALKKDVNPWIFYKTSYYDFTEGKIDTSEAVVPLRKSTGLSDGIKPADELENKILSHTNNILENTSNILNQVSFLTTAFGVLLALITLISGFAFYKFYTEYRKLKEKVEVVDENLAIASSIAMSTLPELNYTFMTPERYLPFYKQLSEIVDKLIMEGDDKILKAPGGARILNARGEFYFLTGHVEKAITIWKTITMHHKTPYSVLKATDLKLAIAYNQINEMEKALIYLDKIQNDQKIYHLSIFFRYLWQGHIFEQDLSFLNFESLIFNRVSANIHLPEDIPKWFISVMHLTESKNIQYAARALQLFAQSIYEYIRTELKIGNCNLVISWLASLIGLSIWFRKQLNKKEKKSYYDEIIINHPGYSLKLEETIKRLSKIVRPELGLIESISEDIELFWLPLKFKENSRDELERLGKFVYRQEIRYFFKKASIVI